MQTIDFSRSFLTFRMDLLAQPLITLSNQPPTTLNNARIQLECRTRLTELSSGTHTDYVLGASCKTELVGAERDLWVQPNADFCPAASLDEFLIFKSWQKIGMNVPRYPASLGFQGERQSGLVSEAWAAFRIDVYETEGRVLTSTEQMIEATYANLPLVARTEYDDGDYLVCIEHPIKTFNVSEREMVFQTDTGPILVPDFSPERKVERLVERFDLAYAAFNAPDWVEFVVNVPTALSENISVNHYAKARRLDGVRNSVIVLGS
jgi:hypothetical protein